MTVVSGSSTLLNNGILRATTSAENGIEFRVFSNPESGWLVRDAWSLVNISTIKQFSAQELAGHRIYYVNNPDGRQQADSFTVAACTTGTLRCTEPKQVTVLVRYRNLLGKGELFKIQHKSNIVVSEHIFWHQYLLKNIAEPHLVRNEVMKIWNANKAPITKQHLFSQVPFFFKFSNNDLNKVVNFRIFKTANI